MARDHVLTVRLILLAQLEVLMGSKGTPAFMSFKALLGDGHVQSLNDDLESLIYVVLYAALRWLPVKSLHPLNWWMTKFFGAPCPDGRGGSADTKWINAMSRRYTSDLHSPTSPSVVHWLMAAMDLHYKGGTPNPVWNDGKELKKLWEKVLAENLSSDDRVVNEILGMETRNNGSLHVTHTSATSTQILYRSRNESPRPATAAKRSRAHSADSSVPPPSPKPAKRSRSGRQPQVESMSVENRRDEDVDSATMSSGSTSALSSEESTRSSPRSASQGRS